MTTLTKTFWLKPLLLITGLLFLLLAVPSLSGVKPVYLWTDRLLFVLIAGVEVRGGDYPVNSNYVAAVVMLATVTNAPRIKELMEIARSTKEDVARSAQEQKPSLVADDIEPLFE